jgi:hypothetical protein
MDKNEKSETQSQNTISLIRDGANFGFDSMLYKQNQIHSSTFTIDVEEKMVIRRFLTKMMPKNWDLFVIWEAMGQGVAAQCKQGTFSWNFESGDGEICQKSC